MALDLRLSRVHTGVAAMRQDCNYCQLDTTKLGRKKATQAHRTGRPSATLTPVFQTASGCNVSSRNVSQELHEMGLNDLLHTSLRSPCAMPSNGWSGVKLATIGP